MTTLMDLTHRKIPPVPWEEGDNIPWNDPAFSERMLREHLTQGHDAASRRSEKIDEQVDWIHRQLLGERPTKVLDLACGPGLYTSRFARLGHECVGVDYAPAAVAHARDTADQEGLACTYLLEDVREASYGEGFGLAMMISGQLNVFRRSDARSILAKAVAALAPGGRLLLEPQRFSTVESTGRRAGGWSAQAAGLFSDRPHLCLEERFWDAEACTSTERYFIIDAATGEVAWCAMSNEAYTDEEYRSLLTGAGLEAVELFPSIIGVEDASQAVNLAVVGRTPQ